MFYLSSFPLPSVRNGAWTPWSSWAPCSTSCGIGFQVRQRSCSNPAPRYGGRVCVGQSREERWESFPIPNRLSDFLAQSSVFSFEKCISSIDYWPFSVAFICTPSLAVGSLWVLPWSPTPSKQLGSISDILSRPPMILVLRYFFIALAAHHFSTYPDPFLLPEWMLTLCFPCGAEI